MSRAGCSGGDRGRLSREFPWLPRFAPKARSVRPVPSRVAAGNPPGSPPAVRNRRGSLQGILRAPRTNQKTYSVDSTLNIALPAFPQERTLSGTVTDENGQPVSGVQVEVFTNGGLTGTPDAYFSATTTTGPQGNYSLKVLSGTQYVITFEPPVNTSGFPF